MKITDNDKKDAEAWLITTCVTVHERQHGPLLKDCDYPICRALSALATTIEAMEEHGTNG